MSERILLGSRSYLVVRPSTPGPWPVVVVLHGAGGTAEWTLRETRWHVQARQSGFLLVLPEASRPDLGSPPGFLTNSQVWNDGAVNGQPLRPRCDDVAFLAEVLDHVASRFPVETRSIFFTGFSNGAAMTFRFAAEQGTRLAAIAPVAGHCYVEPRSSHPVPTLYLVGREDPLVPLDGGEIVTPWSQARVTRPSVRETLARWATAIGCSSPSRMIESEPGVTLEEFVGPVPFRVYLIDGLGHHWPGGRGELLRRIAGPPSDQVDACAVIWSFFRNYCPSEVRGLS